VSKKIHRLRIKSEVEQTGVPNHLKWKTITRKGEEQRAIQTIYLFEILVKIVVETRKLNRKTIQGEHLISVVISVLHSVNTESFPNNEPTPRL
jgi:hypothetical protein